MAFEVEAEASRAGRVGGMFRALSQRNFRLFWAGAFLSNAGTWMQTVAQGWLVLKLTRSPFWVGFDGFMATLPGLLLTLLGGVFADLVDRKRLLIFTQVGAGLSALVLGALIVTDVVSDASDIWIVLILSFVTGCCMALSGPSYQALTSDLVAREDLANAIALNSTQFQLARVIGPLLGGLTLTTIGTAGCFFANGLSYVAIVALLSQVRLKETGAAAAALAARSMSDRHSLWQDLLEGFRYAGRHPRVRLLLVLSAVSSLFGAPYLVLMPVLARDVYGWGETGLSLMMGTAGFGALIGALLLAFLGDFKRKGWFVLASSFVASLSLIGFLVATRADVALALMFGIGFGRICFFAVTNTLLQQLITEEMRGRVMSMWIVTFIGTMPISSFFAGVCAERIGAPLTLALGGVVIAVFVLIIAALSSRLRAL